MFTSCHDLFDYTFCSDELLEHMGGVEQQLLNIVLDNIGADPVKHNKIEHYY
jgi:hypothetical protein